MVLENDEKECTYCAEVIKMKAVFCKHCGKDLNTSTSRRSLQDQTSLLSYFVNCMTYKYADFTGRARRREYWGYTLFGFIIFFVPVLIDVYSHSPKSVLNNLILIIFNIVFFLPSLSVIVRRLHDINMSGISFVAIALYITMAVSTIIEVIGLSSTITRSRLKRWI